MYKIRDYPLEHKMKNIPYLLYKCEHYVFILFLVLHIFSNALAQKFNNVVKQNLP